jgi:transposase InsO family protein
MEEYVCKYVKGCHTCARSKHWNWKTAGAMEPLPVPQGPWEWTQSDHIGALPRSQGYDAIYVVSDCLTKMAHFIPTTTRATAEELVELHLKHVWRAHGVPQIHNTDCGPLFTVDYTRRFFKALGIDQRHSTAYHPQTQGQVESNNKWLETYLHTFCNHCQNDWADLLHTAEFVYNNHFHPSIGVSPFAANYGYDMSLTGAPQPQGADTPL